MKHYLREHRVGETRTGGGPENQRTPPQFSSAPSVSHFDRLRRSHPVGQVLTYGLVSHRMRGADRGGGGRRREIIGPLKLKYKSNKSADVSRFRRHTLIESEGLLQNEPEQVCLSACCDDGWLRGRNSDSDSLNLNEPEPRGGRE